MHGEEELGWDREKISVEIQGSEMKSSWDSLRNEKMASVSGDCAKAEVWHEVEVGWG